jgi:hypothetical protein
MCLVHGEMLQTMRRLSMKVLNCHCLERRSVG